MLEAKKLGFEKVIWLDAACYAVNNPQRLFDVLDTDETFAFRITDAGSGFDFTNLPDPTAPENLEKENGRGIFLIRNLSDNLEFSENGKVATIFFNKSNA
jgi:anti-sigma regulatory factor (Ser/Thr protein kinase)